MKILLVNKFFYIKGGAEKYMFSLAEGLEKSGHEVAFFSMNSPKNLDTKYSKYFVSSRDKSGSIIEKAKMIKNIAYSKEAFNKMTLLLKDFNPDIVWLNNIHKQLTCSVIDSVKKYNKNIKIYWTAHDLITICPAYTMLDGNCEICEKCLDGNFKHALETNCCHNSKIMTKLSVYEAKKIHKSDWYNKVDLFICPSKFYQNKLEEAKFTNSKIIHLNNPLPIDTVFECTYDTEDYLLYFGRLSKEKGIKTLIEVVAQTNYKLKICGTGPQKQELINYVKNNNISNIAFEGFVTGKKLQSIIKNSKAVVLPSEWYENGPYSAMEAMALGKPLIVSNLGGLPEMVINEKNGYIFNNKLELKESLNKIYSLSSEQYSEFCNNSLYMAREKYDINNYISKLVKFD